MKLGITLPQFGINSTKENLLKFANQAEKENFESLWVFDRSLYPLNPKQPYPGTPSKSTWPEVYKNVLDPLTVLTFVAANSSKPLLGTAVIDMIFHNPVDLAKKFTTIDLLSEGRIICGLGIGWSEDEYLAAGTPFQNRGKRADEFLSAMKKIWQEEIVEFNGSFYKIPKSIVNPKPKQKPHPKILLGGFSQKTFDRMIIQGNGYIGAQVGSIKYLEDTLKVFNKTIENNQKRRKDFEFNFLIFPFVGGMIFDDEKTIRDTVEKTGDDLEKMKNLGADRAIIAVNAEEDYQVDSTVRMVKEFRKFCD